MTTFAKAYRGNPLPSPLRKRRCGIPRGFYFTPRWKRILGAAKALAKFFLVAMAIILAGTVTMATVGHVHYANRAARQDLTTISRLPERIDFVDAEGRPLGSIPWATTRRCIKTLDEVPGELVAALLQMEDRGFYEHDGVNWRGVGRAVKNDITTFSLKEGGSGITQQLVKLWKWGVPVDEGIVAKFDRKFLEWHISTRIEQHLSKDEILVQYLNRLDFGGGFHGIHAAADGFFGKVPQQLTLEESATLIAIIRGPGQYSPITAPEACRERRNLVLRELAKAGKVDPTDAERITSLPLATRHKEWVEKQRASEELRLAARELRRSGIPEEVLNHGGLTVTLTVNSEWDAHAQEIALRRLSRSWGAPMQVAALVIDNATGAIKVFQSGRGDLPGDWNDRGTVSELPPGSVIKPFVFTLAFAQGTSPWQLVRNDEVENGELWPGSAWSPRNAGDRGSPIIARDCLIFSQNRGTVRIGAEVGLDKFGAFLDVLGICDSGKVVGRPSSFIGTANTTVARITRAFTIFRSHGRICPTPHIVAEVRDADGRLIYAPPNDSRVVAKSTACRAVEQCLGEVFTRGTAKRENRDGRDWIGKTGTTNGARHNWFVGSDDRYTCGIWVGYDRPRNIAGGGGAALALPIWAAIMEDRPQ